MTEIKLPKGVIEVDDAKPTEIAEFTIKPGEDFTFVAPPEFDGMTTQVQHMVGVGEATSDPGTLGMGVVVIDGDPAVCLNIVHADGTTLMAVLTVDDFASLGELWTHAMGRLMEIDTPRTAQ